MGWGRVLDRDGARSRNSVPEQSSSEATSGSAPRRRPSGRAKAPDPDGERFRQLFASERIGIVLAGRCGRIHAANPAFLRMLGFERSALPLDWKALIPLASCSPALPVGRAVRAGSRAGPREMELLARSGRRVPVLLVEVRRVSAKPDEYLSVVLDRRERARPHGDAPKLARSRGLTVRESQVLQLIAAGDATGVIAERLGISAKTVASHRENLMAKLSVRGVAGLTKYAIRQGLTTPEA